MDYDKAVEELKKEVKALLGAKPGVSVCLRYSHEIASQFDDSFSVRIGKSPCASFDIHEFPSCCGIEVFHDLSVEKGYEHILPEVIRFMERIAAMRHYTVVMLADVEDSPWYDALKKAKYSCTDFINKNSDNVVGIFMKDLGRK